MTDLPALDESRLRAQDSFADKRRPRVTLLYGSLRPQSFSQLVVQEAARILERLGSEVRIYDPTDLPLPDAAPPEHPKVVELREALLWSDAQVWCSPENFGSFSAVLKAQLEWAPGLAGFQAKPLAVLQIAGAVSSFNTSTMMAAVGRWVGMLVASTQLCILKPQEEFGADGRMKPGPFYDRLVDMMEELHAMALLIGDQRGLLTDRYSARKPA